MLVKNLNWVVVDSYYIFRCKYHVGVLLMMCLFPK